MTVVGELVVAIDAASVSRALRTSDVSARRVEGGLHALELEREAVPAWDLGELLGLGVMTQSWLVIERELGKARRRFGLRVGRCVSVRTLPPTVPIPAGIFAARGGALAAAFSTAGVDELDGYPSGVVLDLRRLLSAPELEAGLRLHKVKDEGRRAGAAS